MKKIFILIIISLLITGCQNKRYYGYGEADPYPNIVKPS